MEKVTWREKICYGLSSCGGCFSTYLVAGYLTLFATDVMEINAASVGVVFLVCELFDALTDILVTHVADRTHTRWGKYRPWLLFSGIPMTAALLLLYWNPGFLVTEGQRLAWLFVTYFILSPVCITAYTCPQYVMLSVISADERERMSLGSARSVGEFASELLVNALAISLVIRFGGDYRSTAGWRCTVLLFAAMTLASCLAGFLGTKERVYISNENATGDSLRLKEKLGLLVRSRVYRRTLVMNVGLMLAVVETVLFSYFCIYNLGHEEWIAPLYTFGSVISIAAAAVLPALGKKFSKREMIVIGCGFLVVASVLCLFTRSFHMAIAFVVCKGIGYALTISCCGILWTSTADCIERDTGIAIPGMVMASGSFVQKILMGLCTFMGTWILYLGGYDASLEAQGGRALAWIRGGIAGFLLLAALVTFLADMSLHEMEEA